MTRPPQQAGFAFASEAECRAAQAWAAEKDTAARRRAVEPVPQRWPSGRPKIRKRRPAREGA